MVRGFLARAAARRQRATLNQVTCRPPLRSIGYVCVYVRYVCIFQASDKFFFMLAGCDPHFFLFRSCSSFSLRPLCMCAFLCPFFPCGRVDAACQVTTVYILTMC